MDKLNLMSSFIAVAEEGTYTAAAKRLGKTKALISTHVSQLEEWLQVRLIVRSTRSVQLTETGQAYFLDAKKVLDDIATLEAQLLEDNRRLVGRLRISAPTTFGEIVLMPFVATLIGNNPGLQIDLVRNDRHVDIVAEGFDLAIRIGELNDSSLIARNVGKVRSLLCTSPHFFTRYGDVTHLAQLTTLPCVFDSNYRQANIWRFNQADDNTEEVIDIAPKSIVRVNSALAAAKLAQTGMAIAYCPDFAAQQGLNDGSLVPVLESFCRRTIPVHVIYPHRKHLSAKVTAFVDQFSHYFAQLCKH